MKIKTKEQLLSFLNENNIIELKKDVEINFECLDLKYSIETEFNLKFNFKFFSKGSIKAGGWIKTGGWIFSFLFNIKFGSKIITRSLPFYRKFYSEIFSEFKTIIENENYCFEKIKEKISELKTKKQIKKIIKESNQHWIIQAQLLMFFEIIKEWKEVEICH